VTYFTPEGEIDYVFHAVTLKAAQAGDGQLDIPPSGLSAPYDDTCCSHLAMTPKKVAACAPFITRWSLPNVSVMID
jgi:hypothetical protein